MKSCEDKSQMNQWCRKHLRWGGWCRLVKGRDAKGMFTSSMGLCSLSMHLSDFMRFSFKLQLICHVEKYPLPPLFDTHLKFNHL